MEVAASASATVPPHAAAAAAATAAAPTSHSPQQIEMEDQTADGVVVFLVKWEEVHEPSWIEADAARDRADFALAIEEWENAKATGLAQGQGSDTEDEEHGVFCDCCADQTGSVEAHSLRPVEGLYYTRRERVSGKQPPRYEDLCPDCFGTLDPTQQENYQPVEQDSDSEGEGQCDNQTMLMELAMRAVHSGLELGEVAATAAESVRDTGGDKEEQVAVRLNR